MSGLLTVRDQRATRVVTLLGEDRPPTLSRALVDQLAAALDDLTGVRLLVLRSTGRAFCGGFDLTEPREAASTTERFLAIQDVLDRVRSAAPVTVALLAGPAVGAGADLALACDYRVGGPRASFRFPGPRFGVVLGTDHLVRVIGRAATDILLRNRRVSADEAHRLGLLTDLAGHAQDEFVADLERDLADLPDDVLAVLLQVLRSDDRSPHRERLEASLDHPAFQGRLDAFADAVVGR